ncbi:adenosylcobinamide-GDP ribazoletransferase [Anoxybacillus rupiensis]|uniref:Adenosylcobinamide-GDP ribazoletransferase n=1 Tax=Anoxybacteroides rupiense TaxID=311460 RepID=A0ABD5IW05_9BACL|nr:MULTISPECIES: adenosylcobinamide-GDP ribazoletransferase [Anoxybacillus]KXG11100.1 Adenosylcobinamide-GDP ribazoletransferase [Anoxybacillus sp. P3H1B]MDE8562421.1 adenosylcobinamide-GDP ribazoletransferase [Anoxybacillus rupiensis]MED5052048.1 adenosylcobinamide-GDP ribazoletransferase [Anoxybacillus rupiensis]OQM45103.1 adenosylcobinamide-GDP ribazoletransferase [Anoxybacillus sp. UARK-01]
MAVRDGWVLALQFLTVFPLRKEVNWQRDTARWSVRFFPAVGLLIGAALAGWYLLLRWTPTSSLFLALSLLFLSIFLSGGLHADGWMDVSDAFFSYRDTARRLEILKDSRVGAFAVLSVVFLLAFRFLFLYETIVSGISPLVFVVIPFFSRTFMALLLMAAPLAKPTGMAAAFREHVTGADQAFILSFFALTVAIFGWFQPHLMFVLLIGVVLSFWMARTFYKQQFGGITGDMLGAFVEGTEAWLWFIIWLLHFFVME